MHDSKIGTGSVTALWIVLSSGISIAFGEGPPPERPLLHPFQDDQGKYGFMNAAGKIMIPAAYDRVASNFSEGRAMIIDGDKYGFIDRRGEIVIEPQYARANPFKSGVALVKPVSTNDQAQGWTVIDADGNTLFDADEELDGDLVGYPFFFEGVMSFRREGQAGLVDYHGQVLVEPQFEEIGRMSAGLARVRVTEEEARANEWSGQVGYIDRNGDYIIEPAFDEGKRFTNGRAAVQRDGQWHYIDRIGRRATPGTYADAKPFSSGLGAAAVIDEGQKKWGFVDADGAWVIAPQFVDVRQFSFGLAAAAIDSPDGPKWGYIDSVGEWQITPQFELALQFNGRSVGVWGENDEYPINRQGERIVPHE